MQNAVNNIRLMKYTETISIENGRLLFRGNIYIILWEQDMNKHTRARTHTHKTINFNIENNDLTGKQTIFTS